MSFGAIGVAAIGGVMGMKAADRNRQAAKEMADKARLERQRQQEALQIQKNKFRSTRIENPFANMQNTYEDLTVNQQASQFQAQQFAQSQANIMGQLRGAAGTSGIAGLAQTLANQGALQTQRMSANIAQQESANQRLRAQGAANIQTYERQGQQYVQQGMLDRESTILGMQMGQTAGANQAFAQAQANQMSADLAQQQNVANLFGATASALAANQEETSAAMGKFGTFLKNKFPFIG
tara:strand:- start:569 stop:1282 length:714 start_codon:yes stop_codon:yes gene_type:complete